MADLLLKAEERQEKGKSVERLRRAGFIPAVIYGDGKPATAIKMDAKDFGKVVKGHAFENLIVRLDLENQETKKGRMALIRDVQMDPLKDCVIHVDFQEVSMEKKLRTKVRVEGKGDPMGVTQEGGVLECTLREVEIECLPMNIPQVLVVDVSNLNLGASISVRDIVPPEGVDILTAKEISVFSVALPKMEEETPKEAEITEPEVIGKAKEPAEGAEGAAAPLEKGEKKEPAAQKKEGEGKEAEKKK
ncbi:MAG: 50S ribosomal protein L25 [Chlamydiae bacterium]|nr:50S ribosomal protein L25 [Chlamydiota bacterium]MBI3266188.1 50S ribosomal protein L25 [Chlamydiota bacterium]